MELRNGMYACFCASELNTSVRHESDLGHVGSAGGVVNETGRV